MLYSAITTIQNPTSSVISLVERLAKVGGKLIVAGDSKGPLDFKGPKHVPWPVEFLSLADQEDGRFSLAENLPTKHYARKNIAYLHAIRSGASCIYETDDDNAPNEVWSPRQEILSEANVVAAKDVSQWLNIYKFFTRENIWPRGMPLDEIRKNSVSCQEIKQFLRAPIQQGLVNGSADVDAIWRLVMDREFTFEDGPSIYLEPGNWCPFNTQTTWWWPVAFPLLYIPSYCSFRMCDIWKSFVAQRCLWAMGLGVVFHSPEVVQDRNPHDLMRDFIDEIPGYELNRSIARTLDRLSLASGEESVGLNLRTCYAALVADEIFPDKELNLLDAWLEDLKLA